MSEVLVKVPQLSESVSEATVLSWHKQEGDAVAVDEVLVEIETDKVIMEVPSPAAGVVGRILHQTGDVVHSDEELCTIAEKAAAAAPAAAAQAQAPAQESAAPAAAAAAPFERVMPSAALAAQRAGLDPAGIAGTGVGARVTRADVEAVHSAAAAPIAPTSIAPDIPTLSQPLSVPKAQAPKAHGTTVPADPYGRPEQRVPMTSLRARIAERLLASQQQSAQLTTFNEVDLSAVMALRARYKEKFEKKYGIKLGFMSFFVKAAVYALRKFPVLNASIDGRDVIYHGYIDVGVAVGTERGLVVPVIRNADQKSFAEIEIEIADYAKRAASGKLKLEEITGGTFTVSNGGVFGSLMSTPIINPPQSAILGIHATRERPVVVDHQIVIRPMNYFALSYDHRLIDGREAVLGLMAMKEALEDPARILLDI
ncbi:MAG: 2-oxoglutarate dehydrogenase complex dihydrolipoyllysine-residue succinyltransferase [Duodenibacillus sp.]|nr:2-oxoglutarate dehydrogenase complex dihydrolipoyllysine-residue succinyltransferase [Duodenibacillus sp.]